MELGRSLVRKIPNFASVLRNLPLYVLYFILERFTNIKTRILCRR